MAYYVTPGYWVAGYAEGEGASEYWPFQSDAFQFYDGDAGTSPPVTPTTTIAVGHGRPHRPRTLHFVVIDGEDVQVSSLKEAEEILLALRKKTRERAKAEAEASITSKAAAVAEIVDIVPTVTQKIPDRPDTFTHELQAKIDATVAAMQADYRRAVEAANVAAATIQAAIDAENKRIADDENDVETLLLMGII